MRLNHWLNQLDFYCLIYQSSHSRPPSFFAPKISLFMHIFMLANEHLIVENAVLQSINMVVLFYAVKISQSNALQIQVRIFRMVKFLNWILLAIPVALGLVVSFEPSIDFENQKIMKGFYVNLFVFIALNFIVVICWFKCSSIFKKNDKKIDDEWVIAAITGFLAYFIFILSLAVISPSFLEFLKSSSAFLASLGVVLAAGVAYWGSSATARLQKENEKNKNKESKEIVYPAKLVFNLMILDTYAYENLTKIDGFLDYKKELEIKLKIDEVLSSMQDLQQIMDFESIVNYKSYAYLQSFKISIVSEFHRINRLIDQLNFIKNISKTVYHYDDMFYLGKIPYEALDNDEKIEYHSAQQLLDSNKTSFSDTLKNTMQRIRNIIKELQNNIKEDDGFEDTLSKMKLSIEYYSELNDENTIK